nr:FkbM family methyltransferase [uncultured Allomuricauda sp.]
MNKFILKNKHIFLRLKRKLNFFFKIDIIKYPSRELDRREKLLSHYNINVVLDVGANIGQYGSELRSLGYKGEIISFEPTSDAFEKLVKVSKHDKKWRAMNISLGDYSGNITINISGNSVSSSILEDLPQLIESAPAAKFIKKEEVQIKKLDEILDALDIKDKNIFLKIDTQGYEKMVLDGAKESLDIIRGVQLEMSLVPTYKGAASFSELRSKMESFGFAMNTIEPGYHDNRTGRLLEVDGLFFRNNADQ